MAFKILPLHNKQLAYLHYRISLNRMHAFYLFFFLLQVCAHSKQGHILFFDNNFQPTLTLPYSI